ncbi:protein EGG APPARATUS-1-like [Zingiber officinale]|uniref:protein EGG APPARATUS-1-like n=1 Tax=Zingiber officinale TaxID=94328 RepID=UPI001C4D6D6A|nr:protein EGG APPARATUS-1-like [Zingiber officinale]
MGSSESTQSQKEEQKKEEQKETGVSVSRDGRFVLETLEDNGSKLATAAAVVAAGLALWGLWSLCRRDNDAPNQTMMRAPGRRGEYIIRDLFESDPKAYFAALRKDG